MTAQRGLEILLKVDMDGSGTYVAIAGGRAKSITVNNSEVDVTDSESAAQWKELLPNAGVKSMAASLQGVFDDDAAINTAHSLMLAGTIRNWQLVVPALGTYQGAFQISSLAWAGNYNGEVNYNIGLSSSGQVSFS